MFCKHCGKEISDDAKFCANCGKTVNEALSAETPKKKKKKKRPILGTIVLIFGVICIIGAIGGNSEPKKVEPATSSVSAAVQTEANTVPAAFTVGDTLEMNNILVTLNDISESTGSQFMKPTDGNVFVICEFTIENQGSSDLAVSSLMSFKAYFDDYAANVSIGAMTIDQSKGQLDGTVAAGKKIRGVVGYEAPKDWSEMEVHFVPSITSSKSFVFNYSK